MKSVTLLSVPRSGSTWLGQVFDSSPEVRYRFQPNMAYSFAPTLTPSSGREEIEHFKQELVTTEDAFVTGRLSISGKEGRSFPKSDPTLLVWKEVHSLYLARQLLSTTADSKVIGLIRSPLSVLSSWLSIPKEFDPSWSVAEEWRSGARKNAGSPDRYFGYDRWKEVCLDFLQLAVTHPGRFCICSYEQLIAKPIACVRELFDFADLPLTEQTMAFLTRRVVTENPDPYSTDRDIERDDRWRDQLPSFIREEVLSDPDFQLYARIFGWSH